MPTGWNLSVPAGLAAEVSAIGSEKGLPYFDVTVKGSAGEAGAIRIDAGEAVAAKPGAVLTLSILAHVAAGALPAGAAASFGLEERSADAALGVARANASLGANGDRVTLTLSDAAGLAFVRPLIEVAIPAGAAVDLTLRVGPARLYAGAEEPEARIFAGGTASDMPIEVGGAGFIPGFTEQMDGMAPGESRDIDVTFPADYGSAELAGKHARFTIAAKALKTRKPRAVDDELAKAVGMADLGALKEAIRGSLQREYDALSRLKVKRALLDSLADRATFPVPDGMVDAEFNQIWQRVEADLKAGRLDDEDKGKDEATLRTEYRTIAERRIRLGLMLSEIGRANNVQVAQDEMTRAVYQEASRYPGQEQQVLEFFRKNPQAAENLRAPLFEEKVVDFMLELAKVTERQVAPEELTAAA
ncbi:trigger factor [Roseomonas sp. JC162]|uniref:Trigger factor n=1 Tax=Neoroseomonas marina TaxID=1232220 RepID=A0A848EFW4_9PROT|nr:trigger factor [Neoroseomonas marina]NMJ42330.1 trigger factor [Neoroseomonas marina]